MQTNNEPLTEKFIETIKAQAIEKWGERRWILELTRAYCKIAQENGDAKATVDSRRRSLARIFEAGNCTLATAIMLTKSVGCQIQIIQTQTKTIPL